MQIVALFFHLRHLARIHAFDNWTRMSLFPVMFGWKSYLHFYRTSSWRRNDHPGSALPPLFFEKHAAVTDGMQTAYFSFESISFQFRRNYVLF